MKIKIKGIIASVLILIVMTTGVLSASNNGGLQTGNFPASGMGAGSVKTDNLNIKKDETVYAILNGDGSVRSLYAVNHFPVPNDGSYTDYGSYEEVESLSEDVAPVIDGDLIQWNLKAGFKDFYYKGDLPGGELPWIFSLRYKLDGKAVEAADLAGRSGTVEMEISVAANTKALPCFSDQFAMMIQVPVNLDCASIKSADGATEVVAGKTDTLAYTVLPGTSKTYRIELTVDNFEMDSFNIGISSADYGNVIETGDISEGFEKLSSGAGDLADGIKTLQNGMTDFVSGISSLAGGLHDLGQSGKAISKGMSDFLAGLKIYNASFKPVLEGSGDIDKGLSDLAQNGGGILAGYEQLSGAIKAQLPSDTEKTQLQVLAQYAGSTDPLYAQLGEMAKSLLEQGAGLETLSNNLNTLNSGLQQYTGGVSDLSKKYSAFDQGLTSLSQGANQMVQGFSGMADGNRQFSSGLTALDEGMAKLNEKASGIPGNVGKLAYGGTSLKQGIAEAKDSINGILGKSKVKEELKSFVSPEKGSVNSVQFIIRTPAITIPEKEKETPVETVVKKNFIQKLVELFS